MPRDLPIGNGTVLVNFDRDYCLRDIYFPHVGKENHTTGHLSRFGVWVDGNFSWVGADWQIEKRYLPATLVTDVTLRSDALQLEIQAHDAVDFHLWVLIREFRVRDLSGKARSVRLFFHHDFHINETDVGDTAFYDPHCQSVIHYNDNRWFLINACTEGGGGIDQFATGNKETKNLVGTWKDAEDGQLSGNPIAQGAVDSTIGVELSLEPRGSASACYWVTFGYAYAKVIKLNDIVIAKSAPTLIRRTENYWRLWVNNKANDLSDLPEAVVDLFRRSLLVIRTQIDDSGAIIAATDWDITQWGRDTYNYMWPRDGALVACALSKAGYIQVAQRFFNFCLNVITEEGYLLHKYNPDGTLASSWHPWLRDGQPSLPIQEDETALVLWALWRHFDKFGDVEFIKPLYRRLITNAAEFMVTFRDQKTGLPKPSYDLWEERYGVHLFTVAAVIAGLTAGANFALAFGETEESGRYSTAAEEVRQGMIKHMWSEKDGRFCRMATRTASGYDLDMTFDLAVFGVFAFDALSADDPKVASTMKAVKAALKVKSPTGGYARYTNDYYHQISQDVANVPGNPWFICTMWIAQYQIASAKNVGDLDEALDILQWVCNHALPSGVLSEQVNPYNNDPLSVSPLTWSHATFVLCVLEYIEKRKELLAAANDIVLDTVH